MNAEHPRSAIAAALSGQRRVFVRDLELSAAIGVWGHEHGRRQRIKINLDLTVRDDHIQKDELSEVVCYHTLIEAVTALVGEGHVKLVETLAERIAQLCFRDERVLIARVRVEKPDAVPQAASVGVEIERFRPTSAL